MSWDEHLKGRDLDAEADSVWRLGGRSALADWLLAVVTPLIGQPVTTEPPRVRCPCCAGRGVLGGFREECKVCRYAGWLGVTVLSDEKDPRIGTVMLGIWAGNER